VLCTGSKADYKQGGPYGENLASNFPNVTSAVSGWGDEREKYDFGKGNFGYEVL
jgi:hypothetical protein